MDIQVNIDQAAIERQVTDAILKSAIGDHVAKAIHSALTTRENVGLGSYKTVIEAACHRAVAEKVEKIAANLMEEKADEIRRQLSEKLTNEAINNLIDAMWSATVRDALKRYQG